MCEEINCDNDMLEIIKIIFNMPISVNKLQRLSMFIECKHQKKYTLINNTNKWTLKCCNPNCQWAITIKFDRDGEIIGKNNIVVGGCFHLLNENLQKYDGLQFFFKNESLEHLLIENMKGNSQQLQKYIKEIEQEMGIEQKRNQRQIEKDEDNELNSDDEVSFIIDDYRSITNGETTTNGE